MTSPVSDAVEIALERTRARIGAPLGAALRDGGGASTAPLDGEWLGGFAQPSVLLNEVSAVSARLADRGSMRDEYGESSLSVVSLTPDRLEMRKTYAKSGNAFVYVGRRSAATLAGYWYSPENRAFRGVFCFVRADALSASDDHALRSRVRTTSPRMVALLVISAAVVAAFLWSMIERRVWPGVGALAVFGIFQALMSLRLAALRREADAWSALLG